MFSIRHIWNIACTNVHRPNITRNLSYFGPTKPAGLNTSFNLLNNTLFRNAVGTLNIRSSLLDVKMPTQINQERSVTQYSKTKGKRKTVTAVLARFYRLDWGIWIRTRCGRTKKLYKKSSAHKRRLKEHVFCNAQQSNLLDKMVSKFYRQPKYFVDDPYEPYHSRENFVFTRRKPLNSENL